MNIIFDTILTAAAVVMFLCMTFVYFMFVGTFSQGYEDCKAFHAKNRRLSPYPEPRTPYEKGWNKAIEDKITYEKSIWSV